LFEAKVALKFFGEDFIVGRQGDLGIALLLSKLLLVRMVIAISARGMGCDL
jgi:hypothetical protein